MSMGPEIWKQTQQTVTHFVASLGTCGTIMGTGQFLREKNPDIEIIGIHPEEGHDIPGVRSIRQLQQTELFDRDRIDRLVEVTNREAFEMALRLNREDSIIAGPSSGMALAGALKVIEDQPGNVVVVMFPDNVFKYASSFQRHFPEMFAQTSGSPANRNSINKKEALYNRIIELARNDQNTINLEAAYDLHRRPDVLFIDVREPDQFNAEHVAGAVNIPMELMLSGNGHLPSDYQQPIVTVCNQGNLSVSGVLILKSLGYANVKSLNEGTMGWMQKGYPMETASSL